MITRYTHGLIRRAPFPGPDEPGSPDPDAGRIGSDGTPRDGPRPPCGTTRGSTGPPRAKVDAIWDKFAAHTHAGLHLEKLADARDARLRTIRIDRSYRGIVLAPDSGDLFVLVRVVTHDEADRWAPRHLFKVNPASGGAEILDVTAVDEAHQPTATAAGGDFGRRYLTRRVGSSTASPRDSAE